MSTKLEHKWRKHPSRKQLVAYAECLLDRRSPIQAAIATHVSECRECAAELKAMRGSLEFASTAQRLEPSSDLTSQILLQARQERMHSQSRGAGAFLWRLLQGVGYCIALAAIALLVFGAALGNPNSRKVSAPSGRALEARAEAATADNIQKTAARIETLSAAVRSTPVPPQSPREIQQLRAVSAMDSDITAAMEALERNPGLSRAAGIVSAGMERQAEALRSLYVQRTL